MTFHLRPWGKKIRRSDARLHCKRYTKRELMKVNKLMEEGKTFNEACEEIKICQKLETK